jgi:sorbitol/mannitol transport system substrate-binding protein
VARMPRIRLSFDWGLSTMWRNTCGRVSSLVVVVALLTSATACTEPPRDAGTTINVLMVDNRQMLDLQRLTADEFTRSTGITVNYTVLNENDVRDRIEHEFSGQAGHYDVASISNFETPFYAEKGWLAPLDGYLAADPEFDQDDIEKPMRESLTARDGKVYAEPFYGESSMLMYRKDVFDSLGLTVPPRPTWQQVADLAAQVDHARPGMRGICLRGKPGWGEMIAPLTTVVNTFGGTWFSKDWQAQVAQPGFADAVEFYVNLLRAHGEDDAADAGFTECLHDMQQDKVAMWYDATSAAGQLEAKDSPMSLKIGYAAAPIDRTPVSGWLYAWAWGIQKASRNQSAAWQFISWASGKDYERTAGSKLGWLRIPDGKRESTNSYAGYLQGTGQFWLVADNAISEADPLSPGLQPRPTVGIQFVDVPEFTDLGNRCSRGFSAAIGGQTTASAAVRECQTLAEKVAATYRSGH